MCPDREPESPGDYSKSANIGSRVPRGRATRRIGRVEQPAKLRLIGLCAARHFAEHFFASGLGQLVTIAGILVPMATRLRPAPASLAQQA